MESPNPDARRPIARPAGRPLRRYKQRHQRRLAARWRLWAECALATVAGSLLVLTLAWHDWIEAVLHVDPDRGSGSAEWATVGVLAALTAALVILARLDWRRAHRVALDS